MLSLFIQAADIGFVLRNTLLGKFGSLRVNRP